MPYQDKKDNSQRKLVELDINKLLEPNSPTPIEEIDSQKEAESLDNDK